MKKTKIKDRKIIHIIYILYIYTYIDWSIDWLIDWFLDIDLLTSIQNFQNFYFLNLLLRPSALEMVAAKVSVRYWKNRVNDSQVGCTP